jgi:hypothetical protein
LPAERTLRQRFGWKWSEKPMSECYAREGHHRDDPYHPRHSPEPAYSFGGWCHHSSHSHRGPAASRQCAIALSSRGGAKRATITPSGSSAPREYARSGSHFHPRQSQSATQELL